MAETCYICNDTFEDEEELRAHCLWKHGAYRKHCQAPNSKNYFTEEMALKRDLDVQMRRLDRGRRTKPDYHEIAAHLIRLKQIHADISKYLEKLQWWSMGWNDIMIAGNWPDATTRYNKRFNSEVEKIIDREAEILEEINHFEHASEK